MSDKRDWRLPLGIAAVGIVGALLGSLTQHFFSLYQERSKVFEERQRDAYVTFLTALQKGKLSDQYKGQNDEETAKKLKLEYEVEGTAAVRRIAVYGDKQVVEALAKWYRLQRQPSLQPCDEDQEAMVAVAMAMRDVSLRGGQSVSKADLAPLAAFCSAAVTKQ